MPLDVRPSEHAGTVALNRETTGIYASTFGPARAAELREQGRRLHMPHVVTCGGRPA